MEGHPSLWRRSLGVKSFGQYSIYRSEPYLTHPNLSDIARLGCVIVRTCMNAIPKTRLARRRLQSWRAYTLLAQGNANSSTTTVVNHRKVHRETRATRKCCGHVEWETEGRKVVSSNMEECSRRTPLLIMFCGGGSTTATTTAQTNVSDIA